MENEQKTYNLNQKRNEFKQQRLKLKHEMQNAIEELEKDFQIGQLKKKAELQEQKQKVVMDYQEKLGVISQEEDDFNKEFAGWRASHTNHIMPYYDNEGNIFGVRLKFKDLGMDFVIKLHDEFDGKEVTFAKTKDLSLPDEKMVRILGLYRKEVNQLLKELGGDPMEGWYWTSTPAEEVFGAYNVNYQLIYNGTYGALRSYGIRINTIQVRVALALN